MRTIDERAKTYAARFRHPKLADMAEYLYKEIAAEQKDADIKKAVKIVKELGLYTDENIKQFVHRMTQE